MYNLPRIALVLTFAFSFFPTMATQAADAKPAPPNIIYIMSDDHAAHALSCYSGRINRTPNLDRLAAEGMRFTNCFCTNSICGPCRAVVLTGKYSHLNGFTTNRSRFNGEQQTVAKLLRSAGYQTAMVGKWHLKTEPTGFDYWNVLPGQGQYYNPDMIEMGEKKHYEGYVTDIITDKALEFLKEKRDPDKPFFLMFHHKAPHRSWQPGPKHLTLYDDRDIPEPDTLFDDYEGRGTAAKEQEMMVAEHLSDMNDLKLTPEGDPERDEDWNRTFLRRFTPEQRKKWLAAYGPKNRAFREANLKGKDLVRWKYQRYMKDYLRAIASVDDNVGRLLDYLDETGLAENTVVMYTSDQGFYLGDHGWFDKRFMYEESLRSPLMIRWPKHTKPGSVNDDIVLNLDFAETFLAVAGLPIPDDMQGKSLKPILEGKTPADWRKSMYYRYYEFPAVHMVNKHYGVRTDRYKLIYFHELGEWELYDLEKDPQEMKSVYDDPAYADVVKELKTELVRLREKYKDDDTVVGEPNPKKVKWQEVLKYEFANVSGKRVPDAFGKKHNGTLEGGTIVDSPHGKALKLDGKGKVFLPKTPDSLDPANKPLVVGGWCKPSAGGGAVIGMGGESQGFCLFLDDDARPCFAIRGSGQLYQVTAPEAVQLDAWTHLAGAVDANGKMTLYVNGAPAAKRKGGLVTSKPADQFSVGAEDGSLVAEYAKPPRWKGELADVRVYWGPLREDVLAKWAGK